MTPQPQDQEYIITREELERVEVACINEYGDWLGHTNDVLFETIRSRPHTSAPKFTKDCMCDKYTNCTDCQQHDITIRNATIVALQEKMCDLYDSGMKNPLATFDAAVFELYNVQSLRTPTQEHP